MATIDPVDYEEALYQKLLYDFRPILQFRVVRNDHVLGQYSGVRRQLDIAVYRREDPCPFLVADAKRHRRRIDVPLVESFIGMLDDVGAQMGLLTSPSGASTGARRRAAAASIDVQLLPIDEALELNWRHVAQQIFPLDWAFHPEMAAALHQLNQGASSETIIQAIESIPFEEWDAFVTYGLQSLPGEAIRFLWAVAHNHHDDGWRFNALRHLNEAGLFRESQIERLLQSERDPDIYGMLQDP